MDTKRLILAIALSVVVIVAYQYLFVKPAPKTAPAQPQATQAPQSVGQQAPDQQQQKTVDYSSIYGGKGKKEEVTERPEAEVAVEQKDSEKKENITVETDFYQAVFTNRGAGLKSFILKKSTYTPAYKDDKKKPLNLISDLVQDPKFVEAGHPLPFYVSGEENLFFNKELFLYEGETKITLQGNENKRLVFKRDIVQQNISLTKEFVLTNKSFLIETKFVLKKENRIVTEIPVFFGPNLENNISSERTMLQNLQIAAYTGQEIISKDFIRLKTYPVQDNPAFEKADGKMGLGFFHWSAYETTYFAAMFKSLSRADISYLAIHDRNNKDKSKDLYYMIINSPSLLYLGPKDERILAGIENSFPDATKVVQYGWFGFVAKFLGKCLNLIHGVIPNYGWAIIILTLFLKIILFPLTYSSSISMAKMQTLQPKIKAIRKKYKNMRDAEQRRQMNMEIMALYKEEKVNPAGGCLPLLLQLPILWGFFRLLSVSINIRQEPWMLWIQDLSRKDPIYLLPILMAGTQIIIQRMTPSGADDTQKKMMYIMPVIMLLLFLNLPSGLNLYWTFSNVLQIGQQRIVNERIYKKKKEEEKDRKIFRRKKGT